MSLGRWRRRAGGRRRLRRRGRRVLERELDLAAAEPDVDDDVGAAGELVRCRDQRVEQDDARRRVERCGEVAGRGADHVGAGVGRGGEVPPELIDEGGEIHDAIMTSS